MTVQAKRYVTTPRWLKVFLDIWENRSRTILVVASIAVGVFAVGMIVSAYVILQNDMEEGYSAANPANIDFVTSSFDDDFVRTVEKIPGVRQAEGRNRASLRISQDDGATWQSLTVIAFDDFAESEIYEREIVLGEAIPDDKEILLEARILDEFDIALGEELLIQLPNGTLREVPVVGFGKDQSIPGGPESGAVAYITIGTLEWLGQPASFNQILVTVDGDGTDIEYIDSVSALVEERIEDNGNQIRSSKTNVSTEHPAGENALAILGVMGAMGVLMLILGGSLIANTLTALLNQQMRQIGVMKLVGARNFQIVGMYLVLIIILGLISLIVSIPLAGYAGYAFASFFGDLLSITIGEFRFVPLAILVQIAIAIIVPILSGIVPVMSGSRLTVEEAISDNDSGGSSKAGWFDMLGETWESVQRPVLIALRNTFRNVRRLSLTLFTLTVAGGIFIAVFNVQASLVGFIGSVGDLFIADVTVTLDQSYREEELAALIETIPGVVETEGWLLALGEVTKADDSEVIFNIQAAPVDTELVKPNLKEGRFLQPGDQNALVVAESIRTEFPNVSAGDTLQLSLNGDREEAWTIVGIYAFPGRDVDSILSYAPYDTLEAKTNQTGRADIIKAVTTEQTIEDQKAYG
ncbi:MAG: ABC transporter permease, partial [Chloroflexota bacterium]